MVEIILPGKFQLHIRYLYLKLFKFGISSTSEIRIISSLLALSTFSLHTRNPCTLGGGTKFRRFGIVAGKYVPDDALPVPGPADNMRCRT